MGKNTRRTFHLLVGATLTVGTVVVGSLLTSSLTKHSWWSILGWLAAGIIVTFFYLRWQLRSQEESPEATKERVTQLEPELRKQVQARSYGARRQLIEAPLRELELDITPRLGWVRDPRLIEPELPSERIADDIVAAFESSKRRLLIVGEPGSGKTIAAYSLIEHLNEREGEERIPLLVNLSAWEAQDDFGIFLVDYLCSSVGYEVHERAIANAFIDSRRYNLILDGLDEIPAGLRQQFSERLDEFVQGLPSEVGVVVTCRTQEYEQLLDAHPTGLGLVQAVEIVPLTSEQLDCALAELAKFDDHDWELFLSQRHLTASQRARGVLSNPLFLNLTVAGRLRPRQLLEPDEEQEVRDLVLDSYLDRTFVDQRQYHWEDARRYLVWIARFLNGDEVSPFGLKTTDFTVFDLADLTPPDPPRRYGLVLGLGLGLVGGLVNGLVNGLGYGLIFGLVVWLILALTTGWPFRRSALSSHLTFVWPSTRQQLLDFLRRSGRGLIFGLGFGLVGWLILMLILVLEYLVLEPGLVAWQYGLVEWLGSGLIWLVPGLIGGLSLGLGLGPGLALIQTRSVLITSRTPKEARSRSLIAALTWLVGGLGMGLVGGLGLGLYMVLRWFGLKSRDYPPISVLIYGLVLGLVGGLVVGLILALHNGGWFVLLQKVAHRRLARAGNLPARPYDFLEWGIERQIFRRVGGGVRYRHNLIQQHLASTSEGVS